MKQLVANQQLERSKFNLQVAEHEMAQAQLTAEIEEKTRTNEIADRLIKAHQSAAADGAPPPRRDSCNSFPNPMTRSQRSRD